ncbi:MAG: hypothetical protein J6X06_03230 [Elusimicrobiaceae bacterium]|nr:hypothetical protein [Elusimicrobiaceae bacterium]
MATHTIYGANCRPFVKERHSLPQEENLKTDILMLESLCFADSDFESYNHFLNEWAQLLLNAINLFKFGYFDCAYYSLRQAIELAIVVLYFHDVMKEPREEVLMRWANQQKFPGTSGILKELKKLPKYLDLVEHLPNLFGDLSVFREKINKIVHKQGYFYLYVIQNHPLIIPPMVQDEFITNFEKDVQNTLKQMVIIRLMIDPIPLLLNDSTARLVRLYLSKPLPNSFVDKYLGNKFVLNYKQTELYKQYL